MTLGGGVFIRGTLKQLYEYVVLATSTVVFVVFAARSKEQRFPALEEGGCLLDESTRAVPRKQAGSYIAALLSIIANAFWPSALKSWEIT